MTDETLKRLSPEFDRMYSKVGRASVPPERLLKASLLLRGAGIQSAVPLVLGHEPDGGASSTETPPSPPRPATDTTDAIYPNALDKGDKVTQPPNHAPPLMAHLETEADHKRETGAAQTSRPKSVAPHSGTVPTGNAGHHRMPSGRRIRRR